MKRMIAALLLVGWATAAVHAEGYRTFTDSEGRSIDARINNFNEANGRIEIERSDGMKVWVSPALFSEADQAYIREWVKAALVLSDSNLRITIKKEGKGDFGSKEELKEGERFAFGVTLENRTQQPIEGLRLEYIYIVKVIGAGDNEDQQKRIRHEAAVGAIQPQERRQLETEIVELADVYKQNREPAGYDESGLQLYDNSLVKQTEDQLEGILIRIYGPEVDGVPSHRDVSYPDDLVKRVSWEEQP